MTVNLATDLAIAIRGAAETVQACVVDGLPDRRDRTATPMVQLEQADAVRLISAAWPKVVYQSGSNQHRWPQGLSGRRGRGFRRRR
jgi:hypothetical protein